VFQKVKQLIRRIQRIFHRFAMEKRAIAILVVALIAVSLAGLMLFYMDSDGLGGAGRGNGAQANQNTSDQRFLWLAVFAVPLAVALAVIAYAILFPQIKVEKTPAVPHPAQTITDAQATDTPVAQVKESQALAAVVRVLNEDEQKVVKAIAGSADGTMLQKDIKWKTGLTRVKTHRVLARLSARGIVKVEKYYNTNRVVLTDWIAKEKTEEN
jgi:uncharacterized membrane protein